MEVTSAEILKRLGGSARDFWQSASVSYWDSLLETANRSGLYAAIAEAEEIARDATS